MTSWIDKIKDRLGIGSPRGEQDVAADARVAGSRAEGGLDGDTGDAASTTGTGASAGFVGRVAGQDDGAERTSGAEVRAAGTPGAAAGPDEPSTGRPKPG
jgi:hypothetical protein